MVKIKAEWRGGAAHEPPINTRAAPDQSDLKKKKNYQKKAIRGKEFFSRDNAETGLVERWKCTPKRVMPGWEGGVGREATGS